MKLFAFLGSSAILVAAVAQQVAQNIPEPLATDFTKLSGAKGLTAHFTSRVIGEAAKTYTLELGKGGRFKLTSAEGFILSDGTNLYEYKKSDNSYTQKELTPQEFAKFRRRNEVFGWEAFFQTVPGSDLASVLPPVSKTIQGHDLQAVSVTVKPDNHTATILVDPTTGLTQGFTLKTGEKEYLVLADKVTISSDPLPPSEFAFTAPDGATLAKQPEGGSFANVQALMNANCLPCHDSGHKRAQVDVTSYEGISATVTPGNSANSLLIKALHGDGADLMPKGRPPLSEDQIASIAKWIDAGAKNE